MKRDLCRLVRPRALAVVVLAALGIVAVIAAEQPIRVTPSTEILYNGIQLPADWPPRSTNLTRELMPLPYLASPPQIIPIDIGRQLFVDDFLIAETTLTQTYHATEFHPATPVLKPDKPWEQEGGPTAMPFSDGVWYDPADRLFKLWYMAGYVRATAYATSKDGIHWDKPALDVKPGTNIVLDDMRDSNVIWLDLEEKDPRRRYKLVASAYKGGLGVRFSPDGIHWTEVAMSGPCGERSSAFYNPFRKVWVYSLRENLKEGVGRCRRYWEHPDLIAGAKWVAGQPTLWVGADKLDPPRDDLKTPSQLYNLDCVAYESLMIGLFDIWPGQPKDRPKPNYLCVGFSRDGFHWQRPDHRPFIPVSEKQGDWNWGNVQSAGGCCLVVGDQLWFYVSGRAGIPGSSASGVCTTGLATLRRDGFASMDAGKKEATLTTRPVQFRGEHLFVNADAKAGELRVEVLDRDGNVIKPFTRLNCLPLRADKTLQAVKWEGASSLSSLAGKPVKFRFHLRNGALYAFWVSPDANGASHGYVAAGGPGFTNPTDTVGLAARGR